MQPLYIDLADDPEVRPQPIHLGFGSERAFFQTSCERSRRLASTKWR